MSKKKIKKTGNQKVKPKETKKQSGNKKIAKTVIIYSEPLNLETRMQLEEIYAVHQNCRNALYARYSGISNYCKPSFRDIRNYLINEESDFVDSFGLTRRAFNMELSEVIAGVKSMWSNTKNYVKDRIKGNNDLSDEDKHYLYYVLKSDSIMYDILNKNEVQLTKTLLNIKITKTRRQLHQLLRRYIRMEKPKISHSKNLKSMQLDTSMYKMKDGILSIVSLEKGKRIEIPMANKDISYIKGNIRVILNREKNILEVHKCIKVKSKTNPSAGKIVKIGVDKGKATLLSSSSGKEYGIGIGKFFDEISDYVNQRNKGRNQYYAQIREIDKLLKTNLSNKEKNQLLKKKANIEKNNLSKKQYKKELNKLKERLRSIINHSIREMIKKEKPTIIILEDLTFVSTKDYGKNTNRRMNMWMKGYLDERINYIASLYNIKVEYVNAAYTSQFCAECGAPLLGRSGTHHEITECANCGKLNANINAGKNILARHTDRKIKLYTKHLSVKEILNKRYTRNAKKNKSLKSLDDIQSLIESNKKKNKTNK